MVLHHKMYHNLFAVVLDYWTSTILRVYLSVCDATYFGRCMYSRSFLELSGIQMTNQSSKTVIRFEQSTWCHVGRDSAVGIVTCYGLDGLGIESQ